MFIKDNVFKTQSSKYHPTHVYKRKKLPDKRGAGDPWANLFARAGLHILR